MSLLVMAMALGLLVWLAGRGEDGRAMQGGLRMTPASSGGGVVLSAELVARPLFSPVEELAGAQDAPDFPTREIVQVKVDRAWLAGKESPFWQRPGEGRVVVPLPGGGSVTVVIEGSEMLGEDRWTSRGGIAGRPGSRALFAWSGGFLHAEIEDPVLGTFVLGVVTEDVSQIYRVDQSLVLPCGGGRVPGRAAEIGGGVVVSPTAPAAAPAANPQHAEVHLMMVHTSAVLPTMWGAARTAALQSAFDLAVARVNTILEASQITARVKLVKVHETSYDESVSAANLVQEDALTALYSRSDGKMDDVHAARDAAGADVVCLALNRRDSASSGLSYVLSDPDNALNSLYSFAVVQYSSMAGTRVLPHELGHVFGCAHDRENSSTTGSYSYSYGYRFTGADGVQYRDIMAYPPGVEVAYFSNPDVVAPAPANAPIGIAAGLPGASNNALTIERNAFGISGYRLQAQAGGGTLINVATRAQVGTGDQVLIGGFVVGGTGGKTLLVRAAGPALRGFGVGDALADPVVRIFGAGRMLAENDDWGRPEGGGAPAGEISVAGARVGAFPFTAGSADAAVLVTLPAGAYTAVVEGARGTTGSALVEAYEVGRDTSRVINLSARAHAGLDGREMHGSFVMEGEPGRTKRVLIRVLGPTLERAPFFMGGVLHDPEMELRDAGGRLLVRNDDWSTGAQGGPSLENDFKPLVRTYSEQRIAATGLAPSNRREPCLLMDLPPGAFTVVVRPFESLERGQRAVPGVGIVEVYEIAQ